MALPYLHFLRKVIFWKYTTGVCRERSFLMKRAKYFVFGVVCTLLVVSMIGTAFATNATKTAELLYRDIKITLDGKAITPKDANGNTVEPFIIDGTTYLPVRAISEAMGLHVKWDDATSTAMLSKTPFEEEKESSGMLEITAASLYYDYGVPYISLNFTNNEASDVIRLDIKVYAYNAYGEVASRAYNGYTVKRIAAGKTVNEYWNLYGYNGAQSVKFALCKYQTADGKTVEIPENEMKWYKVSYAG